MKVSRKHCFLASSLLALSWPAVAFERDHDAHEHGHAKLDIAVEGKEIEMRFAIPAMDIVGFEHQPKTEQQEQSVREAAEFLTQGNQVVVLRQPQGCELEHVAVNSALLEETHGEHDEHHDDHHDEHHDDHHDEHHDDHHDEHHDDEHHDDHDGHHDDEHEHHAESHSEFEVEYHFECDATVKTGRMTVKMFERFTSLEEIEAQLISASGQALFELNKDQAEVKW